MKNRIVSRDETEHAFVRRVLIVFGFATLFLLAWELRSLLLLFFGAVIIATIFRGVADNICRATGWPSRVGTALSILVVLGSLGALIALFGEHFRDQVSILVVQLPVAWNVFEVWVGEVGLGGELERFVASIKMQGEAGLSNFGQTLFRVGGGLAELLAAVFAGIYLATQPKLYRTGIIKLVPPLRRSIVSEAMMDSERALRLWLKGQAISMVVVGVLTGIGLWLLGVPSAPVLGLLAGVLEFIPFAGPLIAALPAILLALVAGPEMALWVCVLYLGVQQFESNLLTPLVQQYVLDLPGVILLFSLVGFGTIFGALGIVLAAPLAVVTFVLVKRLYVIDTLHTETPIPGEHQN